MSEFFWLDIGRTPFSKHPEEVRQLKTSSMVAWKNAQLISLCVRRAHILVEADQLLSRYFTRQKTLRFNAYYSYNTKIGFHTSTTQAFKPVPVLIRSGNSVCHGSISIENYLNKNIPPPLNLILNFLPKKFTLNLKPKKPKQKTKAKPFLLIVYYYNLVYNATIVCTSKLKQIFSHSKYRLRSNLMRIYEKCFSAISLLLRDIWH